MIVVIIMSMHRPNIYTKITPKQIKGKDSVGPWSLIDSQIPSISNIRGPLRGSIRSCVHLRRSTRSWIPLRRSARSYVALRRNAGSWIPLGRSARSWVPLRRRVGRRVLMHRGRHWGTLLILRFLDTVCLDCRSQEICLLDSRGPSFVTTAATNDSIDKECNCVSHEYDPDQERERLYSLHFTACSACYIVDVIARANEFKRREPRRIRSSRKPQDPDDEDPYEFNYNHGSKSSRPHEVDDQHHRETDNSDRRRGETQI